MFILKCNPSDDFTVYSPIQVCYVDEFHTPDGHLYYKTGCRSNMVTSLLFQFPLNTQIPFLKDSWVKWLWCKYESVRWYPFMQTCGTGLSSTGNEHRTCEECCATDICNSGGCQQPGTYIYMTNKPQTFQKKKIMHARLKGTKITAIGLETLRNYLSYKNLPRWTPITDFFYIQWTS